MKESKRNLYAGLVIVLVLIIIGYYFYTSGPQVSATGTSQIKAQPDEISIYINAEARNIDSQTAQEDAIKISDKVVAELETIGIDAKEIQLSNFNVYPEYDWNSGTQKLKGYVASQQLIIKLVDFKQTSDVISSASNSGALVSGINYELSNSKQNEYKSQALNEASKDAKVKASAIASGFEKRLGRLVSVQSPDFNYYPYPMYARADIGTGNAEAMKIASSMDISPREIDVSASVSATYTMTRF